MREWDSPVRVRQRQRPVKQDLTGRYECRSPRVAVTENVLKRDSEVCVYACLGSSNQLAGTARR